MATTIQRQHSSAIPARTRANLNIILWVVQSLLASLFLFAGGLKLSTPVNELIQLLPWTSDVPMGLVGFIGLCEIAGALGLILPGAMKIAPRLTLAAATGLFLLMICAAIFHAYRGEYGALPVNAILASAAIFIVWGRTYRAPLTRRTWFR